MADIDMQTETDRQIRSQSLSRSVGLVIMYPPYQGLDSDPAVVRTVQYSTDDIYLLAGRSKLTS